MFNRREVLELAYGARSFENARKARDDLFGDQNNRKRYDGYLAGLLDPQIWTQLQAREQKLRDAIARDPKLRSTAGAYDRIKNAQAEIAKNAPLYNYLEQERPIPDWLSRRPARSSAIFLNMRDYSFAPWTNEPNPMANGLPSFATAHANHWNWNFFRPSRFTTITRYCG